MDLAVQVDLSLDHHAKARHAMSKTRGAIESTKPPKDGSTKGSISLLNSINWEYMHWVSHVNLIDTLNLQNVVVAWFATCGIIGALCGHSLETTRHNANFKVLILGKVREYCKILCFHDGAFVKVTFFDNLSYLAGRIWRIFQRTIFS